MSKIQPSCRRHGHFIKKILALLAIVKIPPKHKSEFVENRREGLRSI